MTNHDQFDELLDHALSEYRDAEPLSGMEDRVLQRLHSQSAERRNIHWLWGAIAACAALVLIAIWIGAGAPLRRPLAGWGSSRPTATKQEAAMQKQAATPPDAASRPREIAAARAGEQPNLTPTPPKAGGVGHPALVVRAGAPAQSTAKSPQFPTPAPLTAEEHALLAMLHANPDALPKPREISEDDTIAPLEIKPLAGSAAPTQENSNE
jgi:hypothetical protein